MFKLYDANGNLFIAWFKRQASDMEALKAVKYFS